MNIQEVYQKLKPHIARDFRPTTTITNITSGGGGGATSFSDLSGTASNAQIPQALLKDGSRSLTGNMLVDSGITIDGVDIGSPGAGLTLSGTALAVNQGYNFTWTAQHTYSPSVAQAPFVLSANAQSQLVTGLRADQLNKQVIAGLGLTGTGTLTADVTLAINFGTPTISTITPDAAAAAGSGPNPARSDHIHAIVAAAPPANLSVSTTNAEGSATSFLRSDATFAITTSNNPGAATSILATANDGSLTLGTTLGVFNNTLKSVGFGVSPDGAATVDMLASSTSDHTVRIKQLTSQTGRLWRVEDTSGNELIVLDSVGNLQSGNPGFVSGLTGWQITPQGNVEFNNGFFRGSLHATVFVADEIHATGGTLFVATSGKLKNNWTENTSTGTETIPNFRTTAATGGATSVNFRTTASTGGATSVTARNILNRLDVDDPPSGHAILFTAGQILRIKSIGSLIGTLDIYDAWARVLYVEDMTTYYRYHIQIVSGGTHGTIIPAGVAVVSYGSRGDGRILLTSDLNYAPYQDVFITGDTPWTGDIQPVVRVGRLDGIGLPGISGILQYGIVMGNNLANANSSYIVASDKQLSLYRVDLAQYNSVNQTVSLTDNGAFKLGIDVQNTATTALDFDPVTGIFKLGNSLYPVSVQVYGQITVQAGSSGYSNLSDKPTNLSAINSGEGTKLNAGLDASGNVITKVLPGSNVGTPGGSGLYLGADKMGYYSGSAWTLYFDNTGKMGLGGTSGARLAWDGTDLFGTDGTTVQWYARASTGKLYAGGGSAWLDSNGLGLSQGSSLSNKITFYASTTPVSQIWSFANVLTMYTAAPTSGATAQTTIEAIDTFLSKLAKVDTVVDGSGNTKIYLDAATVYIFGTANGTVARVVGARSTA